MDLCGNIDVTWQRLTVQYGLNYTSYCRLLPLWFAAASDCIHERGVGLRFPTAMGHIGGWGGFHFQNLRGPLWGIPNLFFTGYCRVFPRE